MDWTDRTDKSASIHKIVNQDINNRILYNLGKYTRVCVKRGKEKCLHANSSGISLDICKKY